MAEQRALLQTDIVDSTGVTERLGEAAASALWTAHDRIARDLLRQWHGREIDKSDGFLLMFEHTDDAVGFALAYHRAIATLAEPLKARTGVHVGTLIERVTDRADVELGAKPLEIDGLAKPTVARLMALAAPGQTLLSAEAAAAIAGAAHRPDFRLQRHGHWRLRGIEQPIEVFEAGDELASFAPPPDTHKAYRVLRRDGLWLPVRELRHSLPAERDSFINRTSELQDLAERLRSGARLVSVVGPGGTGKTRFAKRFAWNWLGDYAGGVWFCDLSQARTLDSIAYAAAQGLEIPPSRDDPITQIGAALASRGECLVFLDNFEQVAQHAEATVGQWLNRAPLARFVVTTREVLGINGEQTFALSTLPAPHAIELFEHRASAARQNYAADIGEHAAVGPLVALLDGLPLAIELAAARVRVMPPRMVLDRMSERFKLLVTSGKRHDRQSTLRATIEWSWGLLSRADQSALAQLSVFDGGFTLDAAEAVLDLAIDGEEACWAIDAVQSLVEKSMLRQVGAARFDMLRSVQEFAAEQLATLPGLAPGGVERQRYIEARHWRFYSRPAGRSTPEDFLDVANRVTACRRAAVAMDLEAAVGALHSAWELLSLTGPFRVAVDLAARVQRLAGLNDLQRAGAEYVAASAHQRLGDTDAAVAGFERALNCARCASDPRSEARILCAFGELLFTLGAVETAQSHLARAQALADEVDDGALRCWSRNALGTLARSTGRVDQARGHYAQGLEIAQATGDARWEGGLRGNLGTLAHLIGQRDEARSHYERALELARQMHDRYWEGNTRCNLALLHHELGHTAEALLQFDLALAMAREMGHARLEAVVLCNLGIVEEARHGFDLAIRHYEQATAAAVRLQDRAMQGQFGGYLALCYVKAGRFERGQAQFDVALELLRASPDAASLALLHCQRAHAACLAGDFESARTALALAQAQSVGAHAGTESELDLAIRRVQRLIDAAGLP